jgi:hypothetical protein
VLRSHIDDHVLVMSALCGLKCGHSGKLNH